MANHNVIRISEFYNSGCEEYQKFLSVIQDEDRFSIFNSSLLKVFERLKAGVSNDDILSSFENELSASYKSSWFNYEFVKEEAVKNDTAKISSFLKYLRERGASVIDANIPISVVTRKAELKMVTHLVVKMPDGTYGAFYVHNKKADKSPKGLDVNTNTMSDLYMLSMKAYFEASFPGIDSYLVYLGEADKHFYVTKTKASNLFIHDFASYYVGAEFDKGRLLSDIDRALMTPPKRNCYSCSGKDFCSVKKLSDATRLKKRHSDEVKKPYKLPSFTDTQKQVINTVDGPVLVCAGPGSGKTATLVGRMKHLRDLGVAPEFCLAITFTRDAADEIKERCASFTDPCDEFQIMTLHALGYQILRWNEDVFGKLKVLSQKDRRGLISNLLEAFPPLKGFSYEKRTGRTGLLATVDSALEEYSLLGDEFFFKHSEYGKDFASFHENFILAVKQHGFITFDEQIKLCLKLFKERPDTLKKLSARYKYIMVDEYQDIDKTQAEFIYALASHSNILAIGDDDQSIYEFRGGSNRYMLEFSNHFKGAKKIVLRENFRSTKQIVDCSQRFIKGNRNRIEKDVIPVRKGGIAPLVIKGQDASDIDRCVSNLLSEGFSPSDIAVLATKNATLEGIQREVSFKSVLEKNYLIDSVPFRVLADILHLTVCGMDDEHLVHLMMLYGIKVHRQRIPQYDALLAMGYRDIYGADYAVRDDGTDTDKMMLLLFNVLNLVRRNASASSIADFIFSETGFNGCMEEDTIMDIIADNHITSASALYEHLVYMVDYDDDTKVIPDTSDSVLFITSHESKGMEWKAVVLIDDFKTDSKEGTNRLYYVAMTRAKDRLIIMSKDGHTLLDNAA